MLQKFLRLALVPGLLVAIGQCKCPGPDDKPCVETVAKPTVSATAPILDGDNAVALTTANLRITFDSAMDPDSGVINFTPSVAFTPDWDATNETLTLTIPSGSLSADTSYEVSVTAFEAAACAETVMDDFTLNFHTEVPASPPVICSTSPTNGASGVATTANILVTFCVSEAMNTTAGFASITAGTPVTLTPSWGAFSAALQQQVLTLSHAAAFSESSAYTIHLTLYKSSSGLDQTPASTDLSFTTGADTTAPTVTQVTRESDGTVVTEGQIDIAANETLNFQFSEEMNPATLDATMTIGATPYSITASGWKVGTTPPNSVLQVTQVAPAPALIGCQTVMITIPTTHQDAAATPNNMAAPFSRSFIVYEVTANGTPLNPTAGSTTVNAAQTTLSIDFSPYDMNTTIIPVASIVPDPGHGTLSWANSKTLVIPLTGAMTVSTLYNVTVSGLVDKCGHAVSNVVYSFTTAAVTCTPPTATTVPTAGATGVWPYNPIVFNWSTTMNTTMGAVSVTNTSGTLAGSGVWNTSGNQYTYSPAGTTSNKTYTVTALGFENLAACGQNPNPISFVFTTVAGDACGAIGDFVETTESSPASPVTISSGTVGTTIMSIGGCMKNFASASANCNIFYSPQGCRDEDYYTFNAAPGAYYVDIQTPGPHAVTLAIFDGLGNNIGQSTPCALGPCTGEVAFLLTAPDTLDMIVLGDANPAPGVDTPYTIIFRPAVFVDDCGLGAGGGFVYTEKKEDNSGILAGGTGFAENTALTANPGNTVTLNACVGNHAYTVGTTDVWDQDAFLIGIGANAAVSANISGTFTEDLTLVVYDKNGAAYGSGTAVGGTGTAIYTNSYLPLTGSPYSFTILGLDTGIYPTFTGPWNYTVTLNITAGADPCTIGPSSAETEATCDVNMAHAILNPGTGASIYNLQADNDPGTSEAVTWGTIVNGGGCYKMTGTLAAGCNVSFGPPYTTLMSDADAFHFTVNSSAGQNLTVKVTWTNGRNVYLFGQRLAATNVLALNSNAGTSGTFTGTMTMAAGTNTYLLSIIDYTTTPPSPSNSAYTISLTY